MKSGWSREFEEPIIVPLRGTRGKPRELVTLKDAGEYLAKLPKAEHTATEWQTGNGSVAVCSAWRPDDAGAHRHHASVARPHATAPPARSAQLGKAQPGARPLTNSSLDQRTVIRHQGDDAR
jgi:hypothetical protein